MAELFMQRADNIRALSTGEAQNFISAFMIKFIKIEMYIEGGAPPPADEFSALMETSKADYLALSAAAKEDLKKDFHIFSAMFDLDIMSLWYCLSVFTVFLTTVTLLTCGSKEAKKPSKEGEMPKPAPAPAQAPPPPEPPKKDSSAESKDKSKIKSVKDVKAKGTSKMDNGPGDEGGYESCPDMTPEELAKIAAGK